MLEIDDSMVAKENAARKDQLDSMLEEEKRENEVRTDPKSSDDNLHKDWCYYKHAIDNDNIFYSSLLDAHEEKP